MDENLLVGIVETEQIVNNVDVQEVGAALQRFGWPDYLVFTCMLMVCVFIGIYFGFIKSSDSAQDYLIGGRSMKTFPIAMSLIASFISGISLLGIPTEIYVYGTQYTSILGGIILMALISRSIYLPIFHDLKITSVYEYLERRFDKRVRLFSSLLFVIGIMAWLPIVIYVPALAFNQVTGINVHLITPIVCLICIFYTTIGGLKAVVWTDVIQIAFMVGAVVLIVIKGTVDLGGIEVVLRRNWESDRIEKLNFDINPTTRHTVWALVFGGCITWLEASTVNQVMVQRYLSLPNLQSAKRALYLFVVGIFVLLILCSYNGMLIYATYYDCDPLTTMLVRKKDQLLPLLVMEVLGDYPGLPGLFVAGVFSAALSSLSTGLNSMAAVVLEDFCKTIFKTRLSERQTSLLMKATVVLLGTICVGLVFIVEKMGTVLQLTTSVGAITAGPSLALFSMGVLIPWISAKGALIGGASGLVFMSWLCFKAQTAQVAGDLLFWEKPVHTDGCSYSYVPNAVLQASPLNSTETNNSESFSIYRISYQYYALIGLVFTIVIALIVSVVTKPQDPKKISAELVAPFLRRFVGSGNFQNDYKSPEIIYTYTERRATRATMQL